MKLLSVAFIEFKQSQAEKVTTSFLKTNCNDPLPGKHLIEIAKKSLKNKDLKLMIAGRP